MRRRVVVTGLGCVSPLGNNFQDTWSALISGISGAGPITHFDASGHKTRFACEVKGFDGAAILGNREARRMDRFCQFAVVAAQEAVLQSGLKVNNENRDRIGVIVGTGIGGIGTLLDQVEVMREKGVQIL